MLMALLMTSLQINQMLLKCVIQYILTATHQDSTTEKHVTTACNTHLQIKHEGLKYIGNKFDNYGPGIE